MPGLGLGLVLGPVLLLPVPGPVLLLLVQGPVMAAEASAAETVVEAGWAGAAKAEEEARAAVGSEATVVVARLPLHFHLRLPLPWLG